MKIYYEELEGDAGFTVKNIEHYKDFVHPSLTDVETEIHCRIAYADNDFIE